jgi:hypothetical protein
MRLAFGAPTPAEKDAWLGDLDEMIMSALEKKRSRLEIAQEEERASETSGLGAVVTSAKRSVNHSGKLMKRAQSGEWKEKFFVLQDDVLRYWKSRVFMEQGEEPSNTIHLLFASVQLLPVMDRPVCFQVLTRDRIYNLSLPQSPAATVERLDWVTKIRDAIYIHIMEIEAKKPLKDVAAVASVAPRANVPILSAGATLADKPVTLTPPMAASSSSERSASPSDKRRDKERSKDKAATLKCTRDLSFLRVGSLYGVLTPAGCLRKMTQLLDPVVTRRRRHRKERIGLLLSMYPRVLRPRNQKSVPRRSDEDQQELRGHPRLVNS